MQKYGLFWIPSQLRKRHSCGHTRMVYVIIYDDRLKGIPGRRKITLKKYGMAHDEGMRNLLTDNYTS